MVKKKKKKKKIDGEIISIAVMFSFIVGLVLGALMGYSENANTLVEKFSFGKEKVPFQMIFTARPSHTDLSDKASDTGVTIIFSGDNSWAETYLKFEGKPPLKIENPYDAFDAYRFYTEGDGNGLK